MENKEVYVITNDSYGEIIAVTDSEEVKNRIVREELKRYGLEEEWIQEILAGRVQDETIIWQKAQWIGK